MKERKAYPIEAILFAENDGWELYLDKESFCSKKYILGCNFGPYKSEKYYQSISHIF